MLLPLEAFGFHLVWKKKATGRAKGASLSSSLSSSLSWWWWWCCFAVEAPFSHGDPSPSLFRTPLINSQHDLLLFLRNPMSKEDG
jgi:hypothetical protein